MLFSSELFILYHTFYCVSIPFLNFFLKLFRFQFFNSNSYHILYHIFFNLSTLNLNFG
nr:MAG TPA: hypothetical protein [Caudoviricetes sp.]